MRPLPTGSSLLQRRPARGDDAARVGLPLLRGLQDPPPRRHRPRRREQRTDPRGARLHYTCGQGLCIETEKAELTAATLT